VSRHFAGLLICFLLVFNGIVFPDIPTANIYELRQFDLQKSDTSFMNSLSDLDLSGLTRSELREALKKLEKAGNRFAEEGKLKEALTVYGKVRDNSFDYWQIYNKIENIKRKQGSKLFGLKNFLKQCVSLLKESRSFFLLSGLFFSSAFMASLFVFYLFSLLVFVRYFRILSNDAFSVGNEGFSLKKIVLFSVMLLWPLLFFSGWMIFPYIIAGLFWGYMSRYEKQAAIVIMAIVLVVSLFYGFKVSLDDTRHSDEYATVREVHSGKLFSKADYSKFDNELKVYLAYSFYEKGDYNSALDILLSMGEDYKNILKFNLLGNIYYKSGNFSESIQYFKNALEMDENDVTALHNFTLVLAMQKNRKVFDSYAARFPEIEKYKDNIHKLKEIRYHSGLLKRRAMNGSDESFSLFGFILSILKEFVQVPALYFSLMFFLYIYFIDFIFPYLGESTRCSKCSKIIKESATDASNNYCSECYQLFMIKDVIFLEAKVAKEKKIRKRDIRRGIVVGALSLVFPGINLAVKEKYYSFIILLMLFYTSLFFSLAGKSLFAKLFTTTPILFYISMIFTALFYLCINLYSVKGDSDGF